MDKIPQLVEVQGEESKYSIEKNNREFKRNKIY